MWLKVETPTETTLSGNMPDPDPDPTSTQPGMAMDLSEI